MTSKVWKPVPKSLEYDLVTSAIKDGYIPDGYSICWAKDADTPQPVPVEVREAIDRLCTIAEILYSSNEYSKHAYYTGIAKKVRAWLSTLEVSNGK